MAKIKKGVVIKIAPDGTTEIEAVGFQGPGCLKATEPYEQVFGGGGERNLKPEIREQEVERATQRA